MSLMSHAEALAGTVVRVVYDGACPLCARYMLLYRIRDQGTKVELIDARAGGPLVADLRRRGFNLDNGMVVELDGHVYYGPDAMNVLALMGSQRRIFGFINHLLFQRPALARRIYPVLVRGRRLLLRLLRRPMIHDT